jgi:hypothetical protein
VAWRPRAKDVLFAFTIEQLAQRRAPSTPAGSRVSIGYAKDGTLRRIFNPVLLSSTLLN